MAELDFSIIIPHYNSLRKLERLLKSIEWSKNIQVIIVDDKSDEFNENELKEKYNVEIYYNSTTNKGAGTCRNIGLQYSKGKWILFADADDYFEVNAFKVLNGYKDYKEEIIYFLPISRDEKSKKLSFRHVHHKNSIEKYFFNKNKDELVYTLPEPWSKLIKRELIIKNNIEFSEIEVGNDTFFSMKLGYYARKILVEKKVIYCITYSEDSLTSNSNEKRIIIRLNENIKINNFMREKKIAKENSHPLGILICKLSKYNLLKAVKYLYIAVLKGYKIFPKINYINEYIKKRIFT